MPCRPQDERRRRGRRSGSGSRRDAGAARSPCPGSASAAPYRPPALHGAERDRRGRRARRGPASHGIRDRPQRRPDGQHPEERPVPLRLGQEVQDVPRAPLTPALTEGPAANRSQRGPCAVAGRPLSPAQLGDAGPGCRRAADGSGLVARLVGAVSGLVGVLLVSGCGSAENPPAAATPSGARPPSRRAASASGTGTPAAGASHETPRAKSATRKALLPTAAFEKIGLDVADKPKTDKWDWFETCRPTLPSESRQVTAPTGSGRRTGWS